MIRMTKQKIAQLKRFVEKGNCDAALAIHAPSMIDHIEVLEKENSQLRTKIDEINDQSKYEALKHHMKLVRDDPDTDVCTALAIQGAITTVNNLHKTKVDDNEAINRMAQDLTKKFQIPGFQSAYEDGFIEEAMKTQGKGVDIKKLCKKVFKKLGIEDLCTDKIPNEYTMTIGEAINATLAGKDVEMEGQELLYLKTSEDYSGNTTDISWFNNGKDRYQPVDGIHSEFSVSSRIFGDAGIKESKFRIRERD